MTVLSTFRFLRPHFLWLAAALFLLPFILKKFSVSSNAWEKVCDKVLFSFLTTGKEKNKQKNFSFWIYLGFLSAVIAMAGPSFRQTTQPVIVQETPLMIVLDLSSDMNRVESSLSRLSRAKIEISDILQKSKAAPSGLIVYTYEPFLISPLAYDSNIIKNLLKAVNTNIMPLGGNKVDRALDLAVAKLKSNNYLQGNILLLTADIPLGFDTALQTAQKAASEGYKISVYGLSSKTNEKLKKLAETGGGVYINTGYASSESLIKLLKNSRPDDYQENKNTVSVPEDNGIFFVVISLICVLRLFLSGLFVVLFMFLTPMEASAGFLFNNNQEGAILFSSREFNKAAQKFKNEDWKAAAYYKAGDYAHALKIFNNKTDITSLYNKGNTLAQSGKISDAIKTYEEVLKKDPKHEDAKFNLEYLKRLAQQQQAQSQNKNQEEQNQNNTEQNDKQNEQNQNNADQKQNNNEKQNQDNADNQDEQNQDNSKENDKQNDQNQEQNNQNDMNNPQNQPKPDEQKDNKSDENSEQKNNDENKNESNTAQQDQKASVMPAKEQEAPEYDETVQAREQKFRAIKEDTGGLLKAFIKEEYLKKRYND